MITKYMPKNSKTISTVNVDIELGTIFNNINVTIQLDPIQRWEIYEEKESSITLKLEDTYINMTKKWLYDNFNPISYYEYGAEREIEDQIKIDALKKSAKFFEEFKLNKEHYSEEELKLFETAKSNAITCLNFMMVSKYLMDDMNNKCNIFERMIKENDDNTVN